MEDIPCSSQNCTARIVVTDMPVSTHAIFASSSYPCVHLNHISPKITASFIKKYSVKLSTHITIISEPQKLQLNLIFLFFEKVDLELDNFSLGQKKVESICSHSKLNAVSRPIQIKDIFQWQPMTFNSYDEIIYSANKGQF